MNGGNNVNKNTNDSLDTDMDKMDLYLNDFENFGDTINFGTNDNANYMGFPNTNNSNNALDNDTNLSDFDVNFSNVSEFNTLDGIVDDLSNFSNGTDTQSMNSDLTNFTSMSSNGNSLGNRGGKANDADIYDWGMNNVGNQNDVTGNFANSSRNMAEAGGFNNDKRLMTCSTCCLTRGTNHFQMDSSRTATGRIIPFPTRLAICSCLQMRDQTESGLITPTVLETQAPPLVETETRN